MAAPWEQSNTPVPAGTESGAPWEQSQAAPKEQGMGSKALHTVLKGIDYLGGLSRTALAHSGPAKAAMLAAGQNPSDVLQGTWQQALHGEAPSSSQYMEKAGVPAGYSLSDILPGYAEPGQGGMGPEKGGVLDPSMRGVAGFVGDVATDPLTYAGALTKYLQPLSELSKGGSSKLYKSAFKNIDKELVAANKAKAGEAPFAKAMESQGFAGSMAKAREANNAMLQQAGQQIGDIPKQAAEKGMTVSMEDAVKQGQAFIDNLAANPHPDVEKSIPKLQEIVDSYASKGEIPIDVANKWKSQLSQMAGGSSAYKEGARPAFQDQLEKALSGGVGEQVSSELAKSSLAEPMQAANRSYEVGKTAQPALRREYKKEVTKHPLSAVDIMLAGLGGGGAVGHSSGTAEAALGALAAKKLYNIANSTAGKTYAAKGLQTLGNVPSGALDTLARRSLWEKLKGKQNE